MFIELYQTKQKRRRKRTSFFFFLNNTSHNRLSFSLIYTNIFSKFKIEFDIFSGGLILYLSHIHNWLAWLLHKNKNKKDKRKSRMVPFYYDLFHFSWYIKKNLSTKT